MAPGIGQEFLERTKYPYCPESAQSKGLPQPPLELLPQEGVQTIILPEAASLEFPPANLRETIEKRTSVRSYDPAGIDVKMLSYLLWLTQGVKKISRRPATARTVPSAGARHAFETRLLVNKVEGLLPGLYHYSALQHQLIRLPAPDDIAQRVTQACLGQQQVLNSAVTFMWVAVVERMTWRYPERGYRYLFLDAGHVCQNLYLAAESIGCGVCAIAAYDDDQINQVLNLDGVSKFVIYLASLGRKPAKTD